MRDIPFVDQCGFIEYPKFIDIVSILVGKLRDIVDTELDEKENRFKRGDKSDSVNPLGVRGELIFQHYLWTLNVPHESAPLLSNRPISSCDIKVGEFALDVKTVRSDAPDLLVNEEAHLKAKGITHYVFIQIQRPGQARYWIYARHDVSKWQVKNVGYSNAYYLEIEKINKRQMEVAV